MVKRKQKTVQNLLEDQVFQKMLNHLKTNEIFNEGPTPTPDWESTLISSWLQKMYQRSALKDVEGNYRRHWLLFDCLESYFKLRNLWYHGPKESFNWLKAHDKKIYLAFEKALSANAKEVDIQKLIKLVIMT